MDTSGLQDVLINLRAERDAVALEVKEMTDKLSILEGRHSDLDGVIERLERLVGTVEPDQGEIETAINEHDEEHPFPDLQIYRTQLPQPKKIRSTNMIAELINDMGRPVNREEVFELFDRRYGIPPTWENPRNALGNALNRAAEKGWITRLSPDDFAPQGFRWPTSAHNFVTRHGGNDG